MKPTLEQIKSHFKNAITVEDSWGDIAGYNESEITEHEKHYTLYNFDDVDVILWCETDGFAKIIKTK